MKKRLIFGVLIIFGLAGCDASSVDVAIDTSKITYSQDSRTKLCFAALGRGAPLFAFRANSFSFTEVPCNPEVLKLVSTR